jgi:acetyl-CoA carboxylase biotin carboxyl carrier protein
MAGRNSSRARKSSEDKWGLQDIRELLDVLIEREITEFEMEKGGLKIRVKRGDAREATSASVAGGVPISSFPLSHSSPRPPVPAVTPLSSNLASSAVEILPAETTEELHIIKSPIVGTFYAAPAPNAPPFVGLGDVVQVGQVLCVIEAMKLMNEIEAEVGGEVVRVYVENGQPVEYGQSLFAIKPSYKK